MSKYQLKKYFEDGNCEGAVKVLQKELKEIRKESSVGEITNAEQKQLSEKARGLLEEVTE